MREVQGKKRKKGFGAAGLLVRLVLIAVLVYTGVTLYHLRQQIDAAQAQETLLTTQVQELKDKNSALRADIDAAGDPDKIKEVARNQYGYVENGEKVFDASH